MIIKLTRTLMLFTLVLLLSGGLVAYAATTLFTQSFPSQTFASPSLVQGATCSGGNLVLATSESTIPSVSGLSATLVYGCDASGAGAFNTTGTLSTTVKVTATFTVPSGWSLGVDGATDACRTTLAIVSLTNGVQAGLHGGDSWVYCLTTSSASNFTSFSITWSQ